MKSISPDTLARLGTALTFTDPARTTPNTAWGQHLPFAFWLVEALRPSSLVELGVHTGVSYCAFCQAIAQLGLPTTAYGLDTWGGDPHAGIYGDDVLEELRAHHDPRYAGFSHLTRTTFDAARENFPDRSIDLLHVDGLHTYEAVRHDFETWLPAMSQRGVMLFHDITERDRDFGVWRLWKEISADYPSFTFPFGHGLGILGAGDDLPENLRWLLHREQRLDPDEAIIRFFAILGERIEARIGMARQQTVALECKRSLQTAQGHFAACRATLSARELELTACQTEINRLTNSASWRLTRPLREARQASRKALGHPAAARMTTLLRKAWQNPQRIPSALLRLVTGSSAVRSACAAVSDSAKITLKAHYPLRAEWYDERQPQVSLIVLNYNKPNLTLACVDSLWEHTVGYRYEIILVDNGSSASAFMQLAPACIAASIVRLEVNRYFGEGNNIGFEASRGEYVVFLNNDVTVTPGWLAPLIRRLEDNPNIGATGPKMIYPDGRLQEAGAEIRVDGSSHQFGKGGDPADPAYSTERDVMYVSAAAVALRRKTFDRVLGFDLCYEPAYYEDSDLCMKIGQLGLRVVYCPDSSIIHHENATSRDLAHLLKLDTIVPLNRERFLSRWKHVLEGKTTTVPGLIPDITPPPAFRSGCPSVLLYTPFNLVPGGGERYLLTIAAGLATLANVTLATLHPFSRIRLLTMGRELSLDLKSVNITTIDQANQAADYDWSIVMGNEAFPSIPGQGKRNIFICQFPFPASEQLLADRWNYPDNYEKTVVYSPYVKRHYESILQHIGKPHPPITIVTPPTGISPVEALPSKKAIVLGVGRFFLGGHAKRQDLMIKAFRELAKLNPQAELHLAGSLPSEGEFRAYYAELQRQAQGLNVFFHINASPECLSKLYSEASLYWHLSGYGVDEAAEPHRCEHFGITVVEAMARGCIPLVVNRGGPPEIVQNGVSGRVFESLEELVQLSHKVLSQAPDNDEILAMRRAAIKESHKYGTGAFITAFQMLLELTGASCRHD